MSEQIPWVDETLTHTRMDLVRLDTWVSEPLGSTR